MVAKKSVKFCKSRTIQMLKNSKLQVFLCKPVFTHVYPCLLCLLMFTHLYFCLPDVYRSLLMFTCVYLCLLMFTYLCLCLPIFTSYLCLPIFICVYPCLSMFTIVYITRLATDFWSDLRCIIYHPLEWNQFSEQFFPELFYHHMIHQVLGLRLSHTVHNWLALVKGIRME